MKVGAVKGALHFVINVFLPYFLHFSPDLAIIRDRGGLVCDSEFRENRSR